MSDCSQLSVPIIAVVIAAFGAWIAARQMLIADERLQLDAFDRQYERRVAVYEATRKFLASVFLENISEGEIQAYGLYMLDAQFLFDDSLHKYLREICQRVTSLNFTKSSMDHLPLGEEKNEFERIRTDNLNWIIQQADEATGFAARFKPFLVHKQANRPWLLRWP